MKIYHLISRSGQWYKEGTEVFEQSNSWKCLVVTNLHVERVLCNNYDLMVCQGIRDARNGLEGLDGETCCLNEFDIYEEEVTEDQYLELQLYLDVASDEEVVKFLSDPERIAKIRLGNFVDYKMPDHVYLEKELFGTPDKPEFRYRLRCVIGGVDSPSGEWMNIDQLIAKRDISEKMRNEAILRKPKA